MSHQEENQVDYVPDSEQADEEPEPTISCKHCIHKDVCFFLTMLDQNRQTFKMSKILELPYDINILATTCKKFETTKPLADELLKNDDATTPED